MQQTLTHPIRIVIYGQWSEDWMTALDPHSDLWGLIPNISEVILVSDTNAAYIPPPKNPGAITLVLPLMEWHIISCPKEYRALISDEKALTTLGIKNLFAAHMEKIGLIQHCPQFYLNLNSITYPAVIKCTNKNGSDGVSIINSELDLLNYLKQEPWKNHSVLVQEWIPGDREFATHLVCKNGRVFWHTSFCHHLSSSCAIKTNATLLGTTRAQLSAEILAIFQAILLPLNFSGPCNIDFKISSEGSLKILEVNPRLGGSLMIKGNQDLLKDALSHILKLAME